MRWVTYQANGGDRVGVVSGDAIHTLAVGVSLVDLIATGSDGLRAAGLIDAVGADAVVGVGAGAGVCFGSGLVDRGGGGSVGQ
jgi:hypothetical protein